MLTLCYSAEIFTLEKVFIGRAVVLSNNKDLAILAVDDDVFQELSSDLTIVFYDEVKGVVTTTCAVVSYHTPTNNRDSYTFTCKIQKVMDVLQRRADVYARLDMNVEILKVKAIKKFQGSYSTHFYEKPLLAKLRNISASGMFFQTEEELNNEMYLAFDLNRLFSGADMVMAEILRIEKPKPTDRKQLFGYGCRFLNMTRSLESSLRQYVYEENRKQLNARKKHWENNYNND